MLQSTYLAHSSIHPPVHPEKDATNRSVQSVNHSTSLSSSSLPSYRPYFTSCPLLCVSVCACTYSVARTSRGGENHEERGATSTSCNHLHHLHTHANTVSFRSMVTLLLMVMLMISAEKYSGLLFFPLSPSLSSSSSSFSLSPSLSISPFPFNLEVLTSSPPSQTPSLCVCVCVSVVTSRRMTPTEP